jgi:hypothetical protein
MTGRRGAPLVWNRILFPGDSRKRDTGQEFADIFSPVVGWNAARVLRHQNHWDMKDLTLKGRNHLVSLSSIRISEHVRLDNYDRKSHVLFFDDRSLESHFFPHRAFAALAPIWDRLRGDLRGGAGSMPKGNADFDTTQPLRLQQLEQNSAIRPAQERLMGTSAMCRTEVAFLGGCGAPVWAGWPSGSAGSSTAQRGALWRNGWPTVAQKQQGPPPASTGGGPGRREGA